MLDDIDRRLLAVSREGLPLVLDPYGELAQQLGLSVGEVLERFRRLLEAGVVRRLAAIVDQRRVGISGNVLVAWEVPAGRVQEVGEALAGHPEVTHCYLRAPAADWPYNLYAMVHGPDLRSCRELVELVSGELALAPAVLLPTVRELKRAPVPLPFDR